MRISDVSCMCIITAILYLCPIDAVSLKDSEVLEHKLVNDESYNGEKLPTEVDVRPPDDDVNIYHVLHKKSTAQSTIPKKKNGYHPKSTARAHIINRTPRMTHKSYGTLVFDESEESNGRSLQPIQNASVKAREDGSYECFGMTRFMYEAKKPFHSETIPPFNATRVNASVVIENKAACNNVSYFNVKQVTVLNVTVETCCITNCVHVIDVTVSKSDHILLNFLKFNVPGLSLLRNEAFGECVESLDVNVEIPDKKRPDLKTSYRLGHFCGIKAPTDVFVEYNKVKLMLRLLDNKQCVDKMNYVVEIVPCRKIPYKTCSSSDYVSFKEDHGYISSPGMNNGLNYPNELECEWKISVPEGKFILLKAERILLKEGDKIEIYPEHHNTTQFPKTLNFSDFEFRRPVVLPSNKCTVKFHSDSLKSGIGFNISYLAVSKNNFIPMFSNNSLDCSGITALPEAIRCDYYKDCVGEEDEVDCSYIQKECPGGYVYKGHCYQLIPNQVNISWTKAEELCERNLGAHLVTINTVEESNFLKYFRKYKEMDESTTFLGLRRMRMQQVKQVYKRMWQWTDGSTAFYLPSEYRYEAWARCTLFHSDYFYSTECGAVMENISFICEKTISEEENTKISDSALDNRHLTWTHKIEVFKCQSGEYISYEQKCDGVEQCFDHSDESQCKPVDKNDSIFLCGGTGPLPYSFVCDGIEDCPDSSDETGCRIPDKEILGSSVSICTDGMYLSTSRVCDGLEDCRDASDEEDCTECFSGSTLCPLIACLPQKWINDSEIDCPIRDLKGIQALESEFKENYFKTKPPPGIIYPDGYGKFEIKKISKNDSCPDTHAQCYKGYCIPVYLWCNHIRDCPYGEDEDSVRCEKLCKGLYKCKHSSVCVHEDHLCDGHYHCPYHDDETLCVFNSITCPHNCQCKRYEFICSSPPVFNSSTPLPVRSLELRNYTELEHLQFSGIAYYSLIYLNVSHSGVTHISDDFLRFSNLRILDASHNQIENLGNDTFKNCPVLKTLDLSSNKLHNKNYAFLLNTKELSRLDLSYNIKFRLEDDCFQGASDLECLILEYMNIKVIEENAFRNLVALKQIYLRGNDVMIFSDKIFHFQHTLRAIYTDNYRLCCDSVKPPSVQHTMCDAPFDEISSCSDILRTLLLRAALWIMAILTLTGNLSVIIYRIFIDRGLKESFRIIITCLSTSDLLMGIYLVIIGAADAKYRDRYQLNETEWKSSAPCQAAGFLCLLSSETSALFILLVTIDRLLAIAFPLNSHLHFNAKSAALACVIVWVIGIVMASIPLLPPFQDWQLYTQKAVGVPLPITRSVFPGYEYAFAILIVFNMVVFILVAVGQLLIYLSVRLQNVPQVSELRLRQDTIIAKRLALVIITDCLCWFPITVMGLAARSGYPVPGEMYVVATVFLLPANSAFNPFLYTANAILLARRMRKKKQCIEIDIGLRQLSTT
uniref:G-protein coupled receptors family 1 profile domain-containing protein n=1 Tax=Biomphalaria glabrata TaxID=6526 RepID=A0A2C9K3F7_BIOGL